MLARLTPTTKFLTLGLALAIVPAARSNTINTSTPGDIASFQAGLNVQHFDSLTAQTITDYNPVTATATIFNDPTQPAVWYNSGGGNFFNPPATDPTTATPIGIFAPSGGIANDRLTPNNVAGPLAINTTTAFGSGAFMEVLFTAGVSSIGFYVPFITPGQTLTLFLKDAGAGNITGPDSGGALTAGQFVGINRASADIHGLSLISSDGKFTIDDLTYGARTTSGNGNSGSSVPDTGASLSLVISLASLWTAKRKLDVRARA